MKGMGVVAIHQPNFMPWLGFFHKVAMADLFILLDDVPFSRNGYQNRVRIKTAQGEHWITVPVLTKGRFGQLTKDVEINAAIHWRKQHLRTLDLNYGRAPFFGDISAWLESLYEHEGSLLARLSQSMIEAALSKLGLKTDLVVSSSLGAKGSGSELLLDLVQAVGGAVYLSGPSGHDYLDASIFEREGIAVQFQDFHHPIYPQLYGEFIPGLSIIDYLMNVGWSVARSYFRELAPPLARDNTVDSESQHNISQTAGGGSI